MADEASGPAAAEERRSSAPDGGATWRQARKLELHEEISKLAAEIEATEVQRQALTQRIGVLSSQLSEKQHALQELDESRQVEGNYSTSIKVQLDSETVAGQRLVAALASGSLIEFIAPEAGAAGVVIWVEVPIGTFNYTSSGHWSNDFDMIDVTFPKLAKGEPLGIHLRPIRFAGEKAMVVASAPPAGSPAAGLCMPGDLVLGDHCERDVLLLQKKAGKGKMQLRRPRPVHARVVDAPTPGAALALALVGDAEPLTDPQPGGTTAEGAPPLRRGNSLVGAIRRQLSGGGRQRSNSGSSPHVDPLRYEDDPVARAHRPAGTHQLQAAMDAGDAQVLAAAIEEAQAAGVAAEDLQTAVEQLSLLDREAARAPPPPTYGDHDPHGLAPAPTTRGFI